MEWTLASQNCSPFHLITQCSVHPSGGPVLEATFAFPLSQKILSLTIVEIMLLPKGEMPVENLSQNSKYSFEGKAT